MTTGFHKNNGILPKMNFIFVNFVIVKFVIVKILFFLRFRYLQE